MIFSPSNDFIIHRNLRDESDYVVRAAEHVVWRVPMVLIVDGNALHEEGDGNRVAEVGGGCDDGGEGFIETGMR